MRMRRQVVVHLSDGPNQQCGSGSIVRVSSVTRRAKDPFTLTRTHISNGPSIMAHQFRKRHINSRFRKSPSSLGTVRLARRQPVCTRFIYHRKCGGCDVDWLKSQYCRVNEWCTSRAPAAKQPWRPSMKLGFPKLPGMHTAQLGWRKSCQAANRIIPRHPAGTVVLWAALSFGSFLQSTPPCCRSLQPTLALVFANGVGLGGISKNLE